MICPYCQTENIPQARFCVRCGNVLVAAPGPGYPADVTAPPQAPGAPPAPGSPPAAPAYPSYAYPSQPWAPPAAPMPVPPMPVPPAPMSTPMYAPYAPPPAPMSTPMQPQYSYPSQPLGPTPAPPFAGPRFGAGVAQQRPMVRGFIVATVGNVVAVLAYFALHYIEIPLAGGYSGSQLAGLISAAYSFASNACSTFQQAGSATPCNVPPFDPALVLWAEVALAAAAAVLAGLQWFRVRQSGELGNRRATVGILVCSLLSLLLIVGLVLILQASANVLLSQANSGGSVDLIPFLGIGYWLMLLGTVAGFVGAIMQLRGGPLQ